jgi:hypothetical protein
VEKKEYKSDAERPYNFLASTKAHCYYNFTIYIKDVWGLNNKHVWWGLAVATRTDRTNCAGQLY